MVRCMVMFLLRWENFTSISFRGLGTDASTCRCQQALVTPPRQCKQLGKCPQVDPPSYLADQNRCHSLGAQLLVDTQEVDLHHLLLCVIDVNVGWDGTNETNQFPT